MQTAVDARVAHGGVIANGVRVHYVEAGPASGPLTLLLHGFPDHWYAWRRQITGLADAGFRVVAPDLRGYNRSEKPRGVAAYRLATLVADVEALIERLDAASAHVVGHDWGGVIAWELARTRDAVVDRLGVVNAPLPGEMVTNPSLDQALRSWYAGWFQVPKLPEALLSAGDYRAIERVHREGTAGPGEGFSDAEVRRLRAAMARPGALTAALDYYRAFARTHGPRVVTDALPLVGATPTDGPVDPADRVDVPTLVCWGERDPALSTDRVDGLDAYVPDLDVERYPALGHWPHVQRPDAVTDRLRAFLEA